jgi:hypothetical protein
MSKGIIVLLVVIVTCPVSLLLYPGCQKPEQKGIANAPTVFIVPLASKVVVERLSWFFKSCKDKRDAKASRFCEFSIARPTDEYFPRDYQIQRYAGNDPRLQNYVASSSALRKDDFYLYDFSDADNPASYWTSEYYFKGAPAKFRCDFIIHLEAERETSTTIEVLEYAPRVWLGEKFGLGRHGPGTYLDIRDVAPTMTEVIELSNLIKEALR